MDPNSGQKKAESPAEQMAELQEGKAAKQAKIASLLIGLAGLPEPERSEEPPQLPDCFDNVKGMQVGCNPIKSCQVINISGCPCLQKQRQVDSRPPCDCSHLTECVNNRGRQIRWGMLHTCNTTEFHHTWTSCEASDGWVGKGLSPCSLKKIHSSFSFPPVRMPGNLVLAAA